MLVGHWPLTANTNDYSGNSLDLSQGTGTAATLTSSGKIGGAYSFGGASYLRSTNSYWQGISFTNTSMSAWVKYNSIVNYAAICGVMNDSSTVSYTLMTYLGKFAIQYRTVGAPNWLYINADFTPVTNTWYHVIVTVDSSGVVKFYINGTYYASSGNMNLSYSADNSSSGTLFGIGCDLPGGDEYINATINDVRFYDHALSAKEAYNLSRAMILKYDANLDEDGAVTNQVLGVNAYPEFGNSWRTYYTGQYNNNQFFSIGAIVSVVDNVVTTDGTGRAIYTYDVLTPQTTGGGVTAGTSYFIKVVGTNQFTLHAYNGSQDGSQGYINPATGDHKVFDSIALDQRVSVSSSGFPTMWFGPAHAANSALVKEIIPNTIGTETERFNGHSFIRLHFDHKLGGVDGGMAYGGGDPSVIGGRTYAVSFWYRAADNNSVGKSFNQTAYSGSGWPTNSGTLVPTRNWQRAVWYGVAPSTNPTFFYWWPTNGSTIDISEIQLEETTLAMPFVLGSRSAVVPDLSGYKAAATTASAATSPKLSATSRRGTRSLSFSSASSQYLVVPNGQGKVTDQITVSAWAYRSNWQDGLEQRVASCTEVGGWTLAYNANTGLFDFLVYSNSTYSNSASISNSALSSGWHHVCGTYDGRYVKLYIDGSLVSTGDKGAVYPITYNANNSVFIGAEAGNNATTPVGNYWDGLIDEFRIYATALSASEVLSLATVLASLDNAGNAYSNELDVVNNYFPTLLDYSGWVINATDSTSGQDYIKSPNRYFGRNGLSGENLIQLYSNPVGLTDVVWKGYNTNNQGDGGWDSGLFPIDNTKTYRVSVWIKRENYGTGSGTTYHGLHGRNAATANEGVETLGGSTNTNPYFITWSAGDYGTDDHWVLSVAYVMPAGSTSETSLISSTRGLYKQDGTKLTSTSTTYRWKTTSVYGLHRTYLYYSSRNSEVQYFYRPRFEEVNEHTPPISELLACTENPNIYGLSLPDQPLQRAEFDRAGNAKFSDIDETQSPGSNVMQKITNYGDLIIDGDFSEVD